MRKWFYVGLSTYFGLRALDIIVGTTLAVAAPWVLVTFFVTTSVFGIFVMNPNTPRWAAILYAFMVVGSFAITGFSIIAVGGWSSTLRGLSTLILAPLFAIAFPKYWVDRVDINLREKMDSIQTDTKSP